MVSGELERKETTIKKQGLEVRVRRLPDGKYVWSIELSTPILDPKLIDDLVSNVDLRLRKRYLGEDVEVPEPPKIHEAIGEKVEKSLPLLSKNHKLFGRLLVCEDRVILEPLKPLPVKDGAITWLVRYLQEQYGKEKIGFEYDRTDRYFRRIIISEKLNDEQLQDLKEKAAWSFIRAIVRPARRRFYHRRPYRRWKQ